MIPIYFRWLGSFADSFDILAHRIIWAAGFLGVLLFILPRQRTYLLQALARPRTLLLLLCSSVLIALNWFIYIYGVETQRVIQCSLGYFITPLLNVGIGVLLLGERFRTAQGLALCCGAAGMLILASLTDSFPWISIGLAISFGLYTLIRKLAHIDTLTGLAAESFLLAPWTLIFLFSEGKAWQTTDLGGQPLLICSGPATVIPLYCFGQAARLLPLSTLGFLQYLSPSLQFLVAVLLFGEPLGTYQALAFGVVWLGLFIFTTDVLQQQHQRRNKNAKIGNLQNLDNQFLATEK